ncbi:MAG TPA: hypothetical protein VIM11_06555 [Tepidisphaeraceae bacterium]
MRETTISAILTRVAFLAPTAIYVVRDVGTGHKRHIGYAAHRCVDSLMTKLVPARRQEFRAVADHVVQ